MILPLGGMICAIFLLLYLLNKEYTAKFSADNDSLKVNLVVPVNEQLLNAAGKGDYLLVRYLLNKKADCNFRDKTGRSALHTAAERGHVECLKVLLKAGADTESADKLNILPLMLAAGNGHVQTVELLLQYKADIAGGSQNGKTALHYAVLSGHHDTVLL